MKKTWIIVLILALLLIVVLIIASNRRNVALPNTYNQTPVENQPLVSTQDMGQQAGITSEKKQVSFTVNGGNYYFKPNVITIKEGDKVSIAFINDEGTHDFRIDEFSVSTDLLQGGGSQTVSFIANKKGSFEYYCSVPTHREKGMTGTLIVR